MSRSLFVFASVLIVSACAQSGNATNGNGDGSGSNDGSGNGSGNGSGTGSGSGTMDTPNLTFAVVGDTRPADEDDTANYPTAIITQIYQDIEAETPQPQFAISTGDYHDAEHGRALTGAADRAST